MDPVSLMVAKKKQRRVFKSKVLGMIWLTGLGLTVYWLLRSCVFCFCLKRGKSLLPPLEQMN